MSEKVEILVTEDFKYAYRGCDVVEYKAGETVEVDAEVADLAKKEKWAKLPKAEKAPKESKDSGPAPENKDAGNAPENKSE